MNAQTRKMERRFTCHICKASIAGVNDWLAHREEMEAEHQRRVEFERLWAEYNWGSDVTTTTKAKVEAELKKRLDPEDQDAVSV